MMGQQAAGAEQHLQGLGQLRLSWLLRPYKQQPGASEVQHLEELYQTSQEAKRFYAKMDTGGCMMAFTNNVCLLLVLGSKHSSKAASGSADSLLTARICAIAAALQLLLLHAYGSSMTPRSRHGLAAANRCFRMALSLLHAARTSFNVLGPVSSWQQRGVLVTLATCLCMCPTLQLQTSVNFLLPLRWALLLQPAAAAAVAATVWRAPAAMALVPGLQEAASRVCSRMRYFVDAVIFVTSQASMLPLMAGSGTDGQQQQQLGSCGGAAAFYQLQLFVLLLLAVFVPWYVTYLLELRQKVAYWQAKGWDVEADVSPFLPLPSCPWFSCLLVLFLWPVLLWCIAEAVAEWAVAAAV